MRYSLLDGLLLLAILVGAFFLWQSGSERGKLRAEYERLREITGELVPKDPTKIYVRALPPKEPLEFAWRVYFPAKYRLLIRDRSGSGSSGSNSEPVNQIVRVKLREHNGGIQIYQRFPNSSGLRSLDSSLLELIAGRYDQIVVEQLGAKELAEIDPSQEFVLLKLKLSDDMLTQAETQLSEWRRKEYAESIFEVRIGPPDGKW